MSEQRVSYRSGVLDAADLAPDPLAQYHRWYAEASSAGLPEPNAMTLATVGEDGGPSARVVLLKHADGRGFVFFGNHTSRKGRELAARPAAALVLPWVLLHRQVDVRGVVERLPAQESAAYFASRPWSSRIGAWASHQSRTVPSRAALDARWAELAARWPDRGRPDDVPAPDFWGGYVVRPSEVEFWQGRDSRLHDRLVFLAAPGEHPALDDAAAWTVVRREP